MNRISNRTSAGKELGLRLKSQAWQKPHVIALPRGGVPVGREIATLMNAPLDVLVVRKIGAPENPEFAIGAICEENFTLLNRDAIQRLEIEEEVVQNSLKMEIAELNRRVSEYRSASCLPDLRDSDVILVDDGLATGYTAAVAADFLKTRGVGKLIFASPVCSRPGKLCLKKHVDEIIDLLEPEPFYSVASWYQEFPQLTDDEVLHSLHQREIQEPRLGF